MEDTLSEKELGKPIVMSDDEPDSVKACERLSDHSGDDYNEFATIYKTKISSIH